MSNNVAIDMDKIKETFFIECEDHISNMEVSILELENSPEDMELMNAIFRAAHSMKGNSGCLGFNEINSFTHTMETVLDKLRTGEMAATQSVVSILLESVDSVKALVESAKGGIKCAFPVDGTLAKLKGLLEEGTGSEGAGEAGSGESDAAELNAPEMTLYRVLFTPGIDTMRCGIDPMNGIVGRLAGLGTLVRSDVECDALPAFEEMDPESSYLSWNVLLLTAEGKEAVEDVFEFIKEDSSIEIIQLAPVTENAGAWGLFESIDGEAVAAADGTEAGESRMLGEILIEERVITSSELGNALKKQKKPGRAIGGKDENSTIRVETGKIDKLVNLAGELVITQSMLSRYANNPNAEDLAVLQSVSVQFDRNTREIQERVMSMRMQPIGNVFVKFTRIVRDIAKSKSKVVSLKISGEETELDKTLIEKISDPLTHLIRNAVDHGVESPQERQERGKPEEGVVKLDAYHGGGCVVVTVEDNGKGLDRQKIVAKAIDKGLLESGNAASLSDAQVFDMIFLPGFSTADTVTDVSGRGVGMDVVKRNIEELGGSISIESEKDTRTKVLLRIPLTLAVIDGLIVSVGDERFIVPIITVLESRRPAREEVKTIEGKGEVIYFRDKYVPLIRLHEVFDIEPVETKPWKSLVVVFTLDGVEYGLLVDELLGEQQVVIKAMESIQGLSGVAGATILGDGRVALILDGEGIVRKYFG